MFLISCCALVYEMIYHSATEEDLEDENNILITSSIGNGVTEPMSFKIKKKIIIKN